MLVVACSGGDDALTLDEYVEWCEAAQSDIDLFEQDQATWGEVADSLESWIDEVGSINPPEEVRRYHEGSLSAIQAYVAVAQQEEREEIFNPFALLGAALLVRGIIEEAEESLSPDTRAALEESGCLSSDDGGDSSVSSSGAQVDRSAVAAMGDRITVERSQSEDRFEMVVRSRPQQVGDSYRVRVTVFSVIDEWSYDTSIWTADQIELVSAPDENGRIYKLTETTSFWDRPDDSLEGVILKIGGKHDGALYFSDGDAPPNTQFVELRYPTDGTRRVVDLSE